jgi:hypothetical protein
MSSLHTPGLTSSQYASSVPPSQSWGSYTDQLYQAQAQMHRGYGGVDFSAQYGATLNQVTSTNNPSINPATLASTQAHSNPFHSGNSFAFASPSHLPPPTSAPSSTNDPVAPGAAQRQYTPSDQPNRQWDENSWGEIVSHFVLGPLELFQHALATTRNPRSTTAGLSREWGPVSAAPVIYSSITRLTLTPYSSASGSTALSLAPSGSGGH